MKSKIFQVSLDISHIAWEASKQIVQGLGYIHAKKPSIIMSRSNIVSMSSALQRGSLNEVAMRRRVAHVIFLLLHCRGAQDGYVSDKKAFNHYASSKHRFDELCIAERLKMVM